MITFQVKKTSQYQGHRDSIYRLSSLNHTNKFLSASGDGMVVEWDTHQPDKGKLIINHANPVYSILYINDLDYLYTAENYFGIHLIDKKNHKQISATKIDDNVAFYDMKDYGTHLFVGASDGLFYILDKYNLSLLHRLKISSQNIRTIQVVSETNELLLGASDGLIYVLDLSDFTVKHKIKAHESAVFKVLHDPNQKCLYTIGKDARLKKWTYNENFQLDKEVVAHMFALKDVTVNPLFPKLMATSSMDKTIKIWESQSLTLRKVVDRSRYNGHLNSVNSLLWLEDADNTLISAGDDKLIMAWKLENLCEVP